MNTTLRIAAVMVATLLFAACKEDAEANDSTSPGADETPATSTKTVNQTDAPKQLSGHLKKVEDKTQMKEQAQSEAITITGTVTYKDLEGGFFGLIAEDGKRYLLQKFPNKYRQHGLVVKVTGTLRTDIMTIQQFGTPLEADEVEIIDDSMVKPINNEM